MSDGQERTQGDEVGTAEVDLTLVEGMLRLSPLKPAAE
jgi:hypothetical protein